MNVTNSPIPSRHFPKDASPSLSEFKSLCSRNTQSKQYPLASSIQSNIPIYTLPPFSSLTPSQISALQDEWHHILLSGPGVFVTKATLPRPLITQTNTIYTSIIDAERATAKGDHFSSAGNNSRIWNSFSKHALADPASFVAYYSSPWLSAISAAWLGPAYRITAQVNLVCPGGAAQVGHCDYHLGFQTAEATAAYPKVTQIATQLLTLQGAVAHSDMPLASGPTRFLRFSQAFEAGYVVYRMPEFQEFFQQNFVSVPLEMGDGVWFNPALFHAAGENTTSDVERCANLLQVSSAFGRTMESVDAVPLVEKCWGKLVEMFKGRDGVQRQKPW
ncbi:uncharacterized protein BDZ99DRAFT_463982 [Mytilinidion resinicola]|uniref:Phytanoyl-CoA dioxygenase family protein n=1 Tax=Mytilinidion resinicola TaxID=574789 RepID=A0A6A6YMH8_9PEZI|nr:uncharacterized protein BDZ99DRAFT_463982 [Mytilinidion resinicola]KAF2809185.1 hypothetical protein BDZ99DRAFT_463982 [Mytilinidion resinicola]